MPDWVNPACAIRYRAGWQDHVPALYRIALGQQIFANISVNIRILLSHEWGS
jgi:hypothetical protein